MQFKNRQDAAEKLAVLLEKFRNEDGVILAVPRGGVPIGYHLAKHFGFPLELLMAKKLGHPAQPEYAIGAVSLEGSFVDESLDIPPEYLETQIKLIRQKLQKRYEKYMGGKKPVGLKGKTVIVVDDGMATGRTVLAAVRLLREKKPARLVVAVPVAPRETARKLSELVDEFVCAHIPTFFYGVGAFYEDFSQVEDREVISLLDEMNGRKMAA